VDKPVTLTRFSIDEVAVRGCDSEVHDQILLDSAQILAQEPIVGHADCQAG
jgi:hypothetical protein